MNPTLALVLLVLLVLGLGALVAVLLWKTARGYRSLVTWADVASALGLRHEPPELKTALDPGSMSGRRKGREVRIRAEERTRRTARTRATVELREPLGLGLGLASSPELRPEGWDDSSQFVSGHPYLDKTLRPRASDPEGARRMFERKALRDRVVELASRPGELGIDDREITFVAPELVAGKDQLAELLDEMLRLAELLEESRTG
ncbi:MAG: hypothetical protein R6V85_21080 [Polyangia bacterium]